MKFAPNTTFSHFKILSEIGKGGMGEVYLAQDTKLDRKVAIKFLSEEFSKESEKLNRFVQEAKATSALNHPNILTVHEIDNFEDTHYIATEFIEGETLRELISKKDSIPLNQILKIGVQTAEALSAAHQAGIAHRDIKPENIMLRKDGYVKVLDFGLAKLTEKKKTEDDISLEGKTKALVKTTPGLVMGTVSYMSPEQARGRETDERTDIWSLGVVLYEMFAGKVPFAGETINHTIVAILETEPKLLENVPDELQRIIRKTLTKEKDSRYQTAKDLVIDLKNLRRDLDLQGELERSIIPNTDTEFAIESETAIHSDGTTGETSAGQVPVTQNVTTSSSLEYAVIQAKSNKILATVLGIILIGIVSALVYFTFLRTSGSGPIDSIAVMPFTGIADGSEAQYLSDGLTESIIYNLSKVPRLRVLPSSTVFRYKGKEVSAETIGSELGVRAVLFSRISQRGDDLQISTELIDTTQNKVIWGDRYERNLKDALSIQKEISKEISEKLSLQLSSSEEKDLTKEYTASPEAYQEYLKGRYQLAKRVPENIRQSIKHFERAVELDPNYARAWSSLADAYVLLPQYSMLAADEKPAKAKSAVEKAIQIDADLAEAHTSLGLILLSDYKIDLAEKAYRKGIELDPKYSTAHHWLALLLSMTRRDKEALKHIDIAHELEPLSLVINRNVGTVYQWAQNFERAETQYRKTLELDPTFSEASQWLAVTLARQNRPDEAITVAKKAVEKGNIQDKATLAIVYSLAGKKTEAEAVLKADIEGKEINEVYLARLFSVLGDKDKAFEQLEKAYEKKRYRLLYLKAFPEYENLRDDSRYKDLVKRIGFPEIANSE